VTAEAMAYGRPVIGARAGATTELVDDGVNGFLFDEGDSEQLAEKIMLLFDNPEKLREMGDNALSTARCKFTNEKYALSIIDIYKKILNS
jgi:glycosyltransferase involved in cell wall biosynthesis